MRQDIDIGKHKVEAGYLLRNEKNIKLLHHPPHIVPTSLVFKGRKAEHVKPLNILPSQLTL